VSFTVEEILQEFAEASRLGRRNHTEQVTRFYEAQWWHEVGFQTLRPKYPPIKSVGIQTFACPRCGATCERREGNRRSIHVTKNAACGGVERKSP
jgi:hypothetical protein